MSSSRNIRVCLKCRKFIILNENFEGQEKLKRFEVMHRKHTLITTKYSEIDNLECGKVACADDELRDKLDFVRK